MSVPSPSYISFGASTSLNQSLLPYDIPNLRYIVSYICPVKAMSSMDINTYKAPHQPEYLDLLCKSPVNAQDHVPKLHSALENG